MTVPAVEDQCWPIDPAACADLANFDAPIKALAQAMAGSTLRMLTGFSVGGCPLVLRPCRVSCVAASSRWVYDGQSYYPANYGGVWMNVSSCNACASSTCQHSVTKSVMLGPNRTNVTQVKVDGVVLSPTAYRVVDGVLLRTDGGVWPTTQDMDKDDTQVGTFAVYYTPGWPVDGLGAYAAGIMACEYAKMLAGQSCRLPKSVTQITRQGISMTITPGAFPEGLTGIALVDAYILSVNPHGLKQPSAVIVPGGGC